MTTKTNRNRGLIGGAGVLAAGALLLVGACRPAGQLTTRTFHLNNLEASEAFALLEPYVYAEREGAPGLMSATDDAVTVRELPENLQRIEAVLAEFDRPLHAVRLHFQLVEAVSHVHSDPSIAQVEEELRKLFNFDGYRLAARAALQTVEDGYVSQVLGDRGYEVGGRIHRLDVKDEGGALTMEVELSGLFATTVSIPLGETVVLGSGQIPEHLRFNDASVQAAILVVTPELVEQRQR